MKTKNYNITKEWIELLRAKTPKSNTWFIKVSEKDLYMLYDILDEIIDAMDNPNNQ